MVQAAYDTTELPTRVDEVLAVVAEDLLSGWVWCESKSARDGRQGWVPGRTVEDTVGESRASGTPSPASSGPG